MEKYIVYVIALLAQTHFAHSIWSCSQKEDCSSISGSVCVSGECVCEAGQQVVQGGSACVDAAPYHTSPCSEDFQCSRLVSGFHCRKSGNSVEGSCVCQPGHHYFRGRCWKVVNFGEPCARDEECVAEARDPFSMKCNGVCQCSSEYVETQRGYCRKSAAAVGQSCVIDQDCRFPGGKCDNTAFVCTDGSGSEISESPFLNYEKQTHNKISKVPCSSINPCANPFVCSNLGICICPLGYYESETDNSCLAELGSPSTHEQCVGFLAEVVDGICTCRSNFFFDDNMRDCVKVTRSFTESCVSDVMCGTFGPSRCGAASEPWGLRTCACEGSMWDQRQNMCRYFAGVGETCELDSDCLAGEHEIQCVKNDDGNSYCACPPELWEYEGLCLSSGLKLGENCQNDLECTGTNNTDCSAGVCSCSDGYQKRGDGDEAFCAPIIGGSCKLDGDCVINNTFCKTNDTTSTCQCIDNFVEFGDICWPKSSGFNAPCEVSAQCSLSSSTCEEGRCVCEKDAHFKDDGCWPITALFVSCSRSSQCYLSEHPERAVCRNSVCQCDFDHPFSEELGTCSSSTTSHLAAVLFVITAVVHTLLHQ